MLKQNGNRRRNGVCYRYAVIRQVFEMEGEGEYETYGVRVLEGEKEIKVISDISQSCDEVSRLAERCTEQGLDVIHINDVIEDFLAEPIKPR